MLQAKSSLPWKAWSQYKGQLLRKASEHSASETAKFLKWCKNNATRDKTTWVTIRSESARSEQSRCYSCSQVAKQQSSAWRFQRRNAAIFPSDAADPPHKQWQRAWLPVLRLEENLQAELIADQPSQRPIVGWRVWDTCFPQQSLESLIAKSTIPSIPVI